MDREFGETGMKDKMSGGIPQGPKAACIGIASATFEIVGLPPLRVDPSLWQGIRREGGSAAGAR
jgi:hypothetical protein